MNNQPPTTNHQPLARRAAFTLVELMITVAVLGIMASMLAFAAYSAQEAAKAAKTRSMIAKLDAIIKAKWDAFKTRRVPITVPPGTPRLQAAQMRLDGIRDLMRLELPDRWSDVVDGPVAPIGSPPPIARPAVSQNYLRRYNTIINGPNPPPMSAVGSYAGAECLYMIVMSALQEEGDGREVFKPDDIGDVDNDGFPEFLDGWKQPIKFLRWAPGFLSDQNVIAYGKITAFQRGTPGSAGPPPTPPTPTTITAVNDPNYGPPSSISLFSQSPGIYSGCALYLTGSLINYSARVQDYSLAASQVTFSFPYESNYPFGTSSPSAGETFVLLAPDPMDPLGLDNIVHSQIFPSGTRGTAFALYPLIYSAGPDKCYGVNPDISTPTGALEYTLYNLWPFVVPASGGMVGAQQDDPNEANFVKNGWLDNIHNQAVTLK